MGMSRNENILENILGAENDIPEPVSRIENLLIQLLEAIGSGGSKITVSGETMVVK